jgi:hypothetical protein
MEAALKPKTLDEMLEEHDLEIAEDWCMGWVRIPPSPFWVVAE